MKTEKDTPKEYVKSRVMPIFNKVLREIPNNHTMVKPLLPPFKKFCLYNPHNYRLYFKYKSSSISNIGAWVLSSCGVDEKISTGNKGLGSLISYGKINYNSETLFKFENCTIKIKKKLIEIKIIKNRWYRVPVVVDCEKYFIDIIVKKEKLILDYLNKFLFLWGGWTDFKIIKRVSEDKIRDEDFINTIPELSRWDNEVCRKAYYDQVVEFKGSVFASNYISNQAQKQEEKNIKEYIGILHPLNFLKFYVKCVNDVLKYQEYVKLLSLEDKKVFEKWLFMEFSIHK